MLCHLQKGQDSVVAQFCVDRGVGHMFHKNGLEALVLDDSESDGDVAHSSDQLHSDDRSS